MIERRPAINVRVRPLAALLDIEELGGGRGSLEWMALAGMEEL